MCNVETYLLYSIHLYVCAIALYFQVFCLPYTTRIEQPTQKSAEYSINSVKYSSSLSLTHKHTHILPHRWRFSTTSVDSMFWRRRRTKILNQIRKVRFMNIILSERSSNICRSIEIDFFLLVLLLLFVNELTQKLNEFFFLSYFAVPPLFPSLTSTKAMTSICLLFARLLVLSFIWFGLHSEQECDFMTFFPLFSAVSRLNRRFFRLLFCRIGTAIVAIKCKSK